MFSENALLILRRQKERNLLTQEHVLFVAFQIKKYLGKQMYLSFILLTSLALSQVDLKRPLHGKTILSVWNVKLL